MSVNDDALRRSMRLALTGDKPAYRFVLQQSEAWLRSYYRRRAAPQMVDDLVQDTLASLHAKRQTFDVERPFLPWLAAIARYRWVDALRRLTEVDELDPEAVAAGDEEEDIVARLSIDRLMAQLPAAQSTVIVLTRIEGRSVAEAASICGQSESLVKVNVHRGLKRLAALVESE